jgi:phosphoribosylformimino-5-aminoimidazole carboxamide ribotide isomerase
MQSGVNLKALEHLAEISSVPVIAAGGVATLADVQKLYPLTLSTRLEGAVSGRALYEGTLSLEEANAWIDAQK